MRRASFMFVGLAVATAITGCGGGSGSKHTTSSSSAAPQGRATNAGVSIVVPSGWAVESLADPPGLVLAANDADLRATAPNGPRVQATLAAGDNPSPSDLVAGVNQSSFVGPVATAEATVGGKPAVSVEFTQAVNGITETTRTVVATIGQGHAYTFTLEAPQAQWQTNLSTLESALASTTFDTSAIPASH